MAKKARQKRQKWDFDLDDDYDDLYDDEIDIKELSRDFYSVDRDDDYYDDERVTARRKIERRRDMRKLYSQLDEWESFGESMEP